MTIHVSQTPETYHMINEKALSYMPDDGILINSARGSLDGKKAPLEVPFAQYIHMTQE